MAWRNEKGELIPGRKPGSKVRVRRGSVDRICVTCGGTFSVQENQLRRYSGGGTYCSRTCKHRGMLGVELGVNTVRYVRPDGYIALRVGIRKWKLEHRVVMERELGRELTANEHVHHINGDKQDNHPENLQVLTNAEHQLLHLAQGDSGLCAHRGNH